MLRARVFLAGLAILLGVVLAGHLHSARTHLGLFQETPHAVAAEAAPRTGEQPPPVAPQTEKKEPSEKASSDKTSSATSSSAAGTTAQADPSAGTPAQPAPPSSPGAEVLARARAEQDARAEQQTSTAPTTPHSSGYAQELAAREALLALAEKRVDEKLARIESIKNDIQALLARLDTVQDAKLKDLVKMYEVMKPKEAARIFATLDMPILVNVVRNMKPAVASDIVANMPSEKAKDLTLELSKVPPRPDLAPLQDAPSTPPPAS